MAQVTRQRVLSIIHILHHVLLRFKVLCVLTDSLFLSAFWTYFENTVSSALVHVSGIRMVVVFVTLYTTQGYLALWLERLTADQQIPGSIPGGGHGLPSCRDPTI